MEWNEDMADIPARTELQVTTGPIRGSEKVHVGPLKLAMREIHLEPSRGSDETSAFRYRQKNRDVVQRGSSGHSNRSFTCTPLPFTSATVAACGASRQSA